jgi:nocturnin
MKAHPAGFQSIWDIKPLMYSDPSSSAAATSRPLQVLGSDTGGEEIEVVNSGGTASEEEVSEFSTWKFRSKGESKRIIDHMWFTKDRRLTPTSRWRMLTEQEIGPNALPCGAYASDHQALCIEFEWQ